MYLKNKYNYQLLFLISAAILIITSSIIPKDKEDSVTINFKTALNNKVGNKIFSSNRR